MKKEIEFLIRQLETALSDLRFENGQSEPNAAELDRIGRELAGTAAAIKDTSYELKRRVS